MKTNDNKLNNLYCIHQYHLLGIQRNSWKSNSNLQLHNLQLLQGTDVDFTKIIYERGSFDLLTSLNWSLSVPTVEVMLSIFTDRLSRDSDGLVWLARPISSIWIFFSRISYIKYRISFIIKMYSLQSISCKVAYSPNFNGLSSQYNARALGNN